MNSLKQTFLSAVFLVTAGGLSAAEWESVIELQLFNGNHFASEFDSGLAAMTDLGETGYTSADTGDALNYTGSTAERSLMRGYRGAALQYMLGLNRHHYFSLGVGAQFYSQAIFSFNLLDENDDVARQDYMTLDLNTFYIAPGYNYRFELGDNNFIMTGAGLGLYAASLTAEITTKSSDQYTNSDLGTLGGYIKAVLGHHFNKNWSISAGLHMHWTLPSDGITVQGSSSRSFILKNDRVVVSKNDSGELAALTLKGIQLELALQYWFR